MPFTLKIRKGGHRKKSMTAFSPNAQCQRPIPDSSLVLSDYQATIATPTP